MVADGEEEEFEVSHVVGGKIDNFLNFAYKIDRSKIIKKKDINPEINKKRIIGGDSDQDDVIPPAIAIEKTGERITKIIVKCPCGRNAELVCEYDDENDETSIGLSPHEHAETATGNGE